MSAGDECPPANARSPMASAGAVPLGVYIYLINSLLGSAGSGIMAPAVPFKAISLGASAFQMCLMGSIPNLAPVFGTLILSRLADKHGQHKLIMVLSLLGASIVYPIHLLANSVASLILVRAVLGIFTCTAAVELSFLTRSVSKDRAMWVISAQQAAQKAGSLIGYFSASFLAAVPFSWLCIAFSGTCLLSSILGFLFYKDVPRRASTCAAADGESPLSEGLADADRNQEESTSLLSVFTDRAALLLTLIGGLNIFAWMIGVGPEPKVLQDYFGYNQAQYAQFIAINFVVGLLSTFGAPFVIRTFGDVPACVVSCIVSAVSVDAIFLSRAPWSPYVMNTFGWGIASQLVVNVAILNLIIRKCSDDIRDAVFALQTAVGALGMLTAPPIGGSLYDIQPFLPYAFNSVLVAWMAVLFTLLPSDAGAPAAPSSVRSSSGPTIRWAMSLTQSSVVPTTLSANFAARPGGSGNGFMVDQMLYEEFLAGRQHLGSLARITPATIAIAPRVQSQQPFSHRGARSHQPSSTGRARMGAGSTQREHVPISETSTVSLQGLTPPSAGLTGETVDFLWAAGLTGQSLGLGPEPAQVRYPASASLPLQDLYEADPSQKSLELLGHGSFGVVTIACHRSSGTQVAMKRVSKVMVGQSYFDTHVANDMFSRLLEMSGPASHPSVVRYLDFLIGPQFVYIVMECLEGSGLGEYLVLHAPISVHFCKTVMKQLLSALAHIHGLGIVHRDVKLDALKFRAKAPNSDLVLYDFGHCCPAAEEEDREVVGTSLYMAPEVLTSRYGMQVDLWSAGVVLYVLLTGTFPFQAESSDKLRPVDGSLLLRALNEASLCAAPQGAVKLLRGLLEVDPKTRLTAEAALKQQWLLAKDGDELRLGAPSSAYSKVHATSLQARQDMTAQHPQAAGRAGAAVPALGTVEESPSGAGQRGGRALPCWLQVVVGALAVVLSWFAIWLSCHQAPPASPQALVE